MKNRRLQVFSAMMDFKPGNLPPTSVPVSNQLKVGDHLEETNVTKFKC